MGPLTRDQKIAFGFSQHGQGDGTPVVVFGIPTGAWEYMRDGKTHTFDMRKVGINVQLIFYGAADHEAAIGLMRMTPGFHDARSEDFSIQPKGPSPLQQLLDEPIGWAAGEPLSERQLAWVKAIRALAP